MSSWGNERAAFSVDGESYPELNELDLIGTFLGPLFLNRSRMVTVQPIEPGL